MYLIHWPILFIVIIYLDSSLLAFVYGLLQSYKYRIFFSLERDIPNLYTIVLDLYRFEFQKILKLK